MKAGRLPIYKRIDEDSFTPCAKYNWVKSNRLTHSENKYIPVTVQSNSSKNFLCNWSWRIRSQGRTGDSKSITLNYFSQTRLHL